MQKTVKKTQKGFTLIELLIVIAVIAILAAIAIPNLLASRKAANESSAISSMRTLVSAQETYRSRYSQYADDIAKLGPPASGVEPSDAAAGLIDSLLSAGSKSGYGFVMSNTGANTYTITAEPSDQGKSGDRHFQANEDGVILVSTDTGSTFTALQ